MDAVSRHSGYLFSCPRAAASVVLVTLFGPCIVLAEPTLPDHGQVSMETVIVTGTRASDRTVAESASPIDIITPEALRATGTGELATALSRLLPSFNFPRPAITDGTDAVRPAQLRGMAPDQVLVLVNGKRRHVTALLNLNGSQGRGSSPVDLNAIPIAAIERVEVLRDGASALYGSDAIAGVVNVVLKGRREGGELMARGGQFTAGDGEQFELAGDAGFAWGERGFVHLAAQLGRQAQTNRAAAYDGVVEQRFGDPEVDAGLLSLNAEWQAGEQLSVYAFGGYSERDVLSNGYFRWDTDPRNIPEIYPNGFLPQINNLARDRSLVLGLRSQLAGWQLDASANHGGNTLDFDIRNTLNRSLGPSSPTRFYAGRLEAAQTVLNVDLLRGVSVPWLAHPLALAVGAEWRGEDFELRAGEPASYADTGLIHPDTGERTPGGSQVFPGFKPEDAGRFNRDSHALYVDVEADINERLAAGVAARYERYSDFGSATAGRLSVRYVLDARATLRATLATGFRAPSLQQQYFQSTATNTIDGVPFEVVTFRVDNPTAIALGAEPLKAERSTNVSLGLVMQPLAALNVTVDAYLIDVDDRIALSENLIGAPVRDFLEARGIFGANGGRYFTNALDTRTRGVDLVGSYRFALAGGDGELVAGYHRGKTQVRGVAQNPAVLESGGLALERIGRVEVGRVTVGAPRDKFLLGGEWHKGRWGLSVQATRYGHFTVLNTDPALDQTFASEWTLDVAGSYRRGAWTFTLGGDNVLDAYPDRQIPNLGARSYLPYSSASPFGFNGAFLYGRVAYAW